MSAQRTPPGPWHWQTVVPETAPGSKPQTEPRGQALVASDGTWLVSAESGWGSPEVHPAVVELLARAWVLRPPIEPGEFAFTCDLNMEDVEDDRGNNWHLLSRDAWDPTGIYPGATLWAGRAGTASTVDVLRTELFLTRAAGS